MSSAVKIWKVLKDGPFAGREWEKDAFVSMSMAEAKPFKSAGYVKEADALEYQAHVAGKEQHIAAMTAKPEQMFDVPIERAEAAAKQAGNAVAEAHQLTDQNKAVLDQIRRERADLVKEMEAARVKMNQMATSGDDELASKLARLDAAIKTYEDHESVMTDERAELGKLVQEAKDAKVHAEEAARAMSPSVNSVDIEATARVNKILGTSSQVDARMKIIEMKIEMADLEDGGDWSDKERSHFDFLSNQVEEAEQVMRAAGRMRNDPPDDLSNDAIWRE